MIAHINTCVFWEKYFTRKKEKCCDHFTTERFRRISGSFVQIERYHVSQINYVVPAAFCELQKFVAEVFTPDGATLSYKLCSAHIFWSNRHRTHISKVFSRNDHVTVRPFRFHEISRSLTLKKVKNLLKKIVLSIWN